MRTLLPRQGVPIADGGGMASNPFYAFLQDVERAINSGVAGGEGLADAVAAIARALGSPDGSVANIPEQSQGGGQILGPQSVHVNGALPNMVQIVLEGDAVDPGPTFRYGTDAEGAKGWFPIADALAGSDTATLAVGADGVVTFSLPELPDAGTGTFKLLARDQYGRLSGTTGGTTGDVPEGVNLYHTAARVRATVLTGLSTATNAVIAATDTVLGALGRLQAQITGLASTVSGLITQSITPGDTTHAPSGDAVFDALVGKQDALDSGGYIPTGSSETNVSGVNGFSCYWFRIGDVVYIDGRVDISATAAGQCIALVTLPVPSDFSAFSDAAGTLLAAPSGGAAGNPFAPGVVNASATSDMLRFVFPSSGAFNSQCTFHCAYQVK